MARDPCDGLSRPQRNRLEYSVNVARKAVAMRLPAAERVPGTQGPSLSSPESILFLANMLMHL
jgi:hypothetical protein